MNIDLPEELGEIKLSPIQKLYKILLEAKEPLAPVNINKLMGFHGGNSSTYIQKLIEQGLVEKIVCPKCHMGKLVKLKNPQKKKPRK